MKKLFALLLAGLLVLAGCSSAPAEKTDEELMAEGWVKNPLENGYVLADEELPAPVDTTKTYKNSDGDEVACEVNNYSTSCASITVDNLYNYLGREDVVYIDLRDYGDYAQKHLRNFEVVPYFAYIFNANAGTDGNIQLFGGSVTEPTATYDSSVAVLEALIPQDTTVFLMCQSGGRVAQCMNLLDALGWDMSKIYNVGGMGQFTGAEYEAYTTNTEEFGLEATYTFAE